MTSGMLERRFAAMGARVNVVAPQLGSPRVDVSADRRGEFFDIRFDGGGRPVELEVIDVDRHDRHLLLLVRHGGEKSKFLCGHDERHWFVAAVPESARGVTGVTTAKAALQPAAVRALVDRVRPKQPFRRRNVAYIRQGEWFFVEAAGLDPPPAFVLHNEPLTRGRGATPHVLELAYRRGGETVWFSRRFPNGLSEVRYQSLSAAERRGQWVPRVRDPELFAMGAVRHRDHATVVLHGWHRVLMNTEQSARAMQHVMFLD